jgi:hypothetical protein
MLFLTTMIYAKQFCVRIDCYKNDKWSRPIAHINVEDEINKYLNKGYKLIAITSEIETCGYGSCTKSYYCIFEDGK